MERGGPSWSLLLVLLLAAWHVDVEALPLHPNADGSHHLGEAVVQNPEAPIIRPEVKQEEVRDAPKTPEMAGQKVRVQNSMDKVKQALAAVNGGSPAASAPSTTTTAPMTSATSFDSGNSFVDSQESSNPAQVAVPSIQDPSSLVDHEPMLVKPPPPEFINRDLRPGHPRYLIQNAEPAILTADHTLHKIDVELQKRRDHAYTVARGAKNELLAAEEGSHATAQMANAVRSQTETDMATVEKQIQNIKSQMIDVQGDDNKAHAKLQLQLERAKRKHAELLAQAKTMGEAVEQAITKAGEIEGRARANYHANMDPNMELEHAIIEAAKAKMALAQHDSQVQVENRQEKSDEKKAQFFQQVEEKGQQAMEKIKDEFAKQSKAAEEQAHQKAMEQAKALEKQAATVGTIPAPVMQQAQPVAAAPAETPQAAAASAQAAIQNAHETGNPADAEEAMKKIQAQQQAAQPTAAPAPAVPAVPQSVSETVDQSAEIAKEAAKVAEPSTADDNAADETAADETETPEAEESDAAESPS